MEGGLACPPQLILLSQVSTAGKVQIYNIRIFDLLTDFCFQKKRLPICLIRIFTGSINNNRPLT